MGLLDRAVQKYRNRQTRKALEHPAVRHGVQQAADAKARVMVAERNTLRAKANRKAKARAASKHARAARKTNR